MIKEIFQVLQLRLLDKLGSRLGEVDYFLQQYTQAGDNFQITTPAVYFEFQELPTENIGNLAQMVELKLRVHTVTESLYQDGQRITDAALDHLQLVSDVYRHLVGHEYLMSELPGLGELAGTDQDFVILNRISRTSIVPDHKLSNLLVTVQNFSGEFQDLSAQPEYNSIIASLKVVRAAEE